MVAFRKPFHLKHLSQTERDLFELVGSYIGFFADELSLQTLERISEQLGQNNGDIDS